MALFVAGIATSFLSLVCVVQGIRSLQIEYEQSLNATVGQNVSLPCIVSEEEVHIIQLEWHKVGKTRDEKLVLFNPLFSPSYYADVKLQLVNKPNSNKLQGTILLLNEVTEEDNGDYVCEISTFPAGSFRKTSKVTVTVPWITAKVESPGTSLMEGDEVKITCASHPPGDRYRLLSLQSSFSLESQTGHFTIESVTRHSSDLICRPLWTSSNQHLRTLNASVQLTVDLAWVTAKVESPGTSLMEGDEVKITCASHPPADRYRLLSLQTRLSLESQTGHFTVQNVTRHCTELICRPLWTSSNQHLRSLNASVQLTVDYLDPIECDANSSSIEVETGTNLSITCTAKSSRPLYYTWIRGSVMVSNHATLSLWSVTPDQSGLYSLIVHAQHLSRLQRQREFMVTVGYIQFCV